MPLTVSEVLARAEKCHELANHSGDPSRKAMLEKMRDLWKGLAEASQESGSDLEREFERLLSVQDSITAGTGH